MVAGGSADRLHFTADALDLVFGATGGVPRVVNRLCDRTLQRGHAARASVIGPDLVRQAMADLQLAPSCEPAVPLAEALAAAAADAPPVQPAPAPEPAAVAVATAAPEPAVPGSDDLHALLTLPPMATPAPGVEAPSLRPERPSVAPRVRAARTRFYREAPAAGRSRAAVATAALLVLGALSGLTLAVYWVWAAPMLTARVALPAVRRPSMRIAAPLPAVLDPNIESVGIPIGLPAPDATGGESSGPNAAPPRPVAAAPSPAPASQAVWVVQVGAFTDDGRAASLVAQLAGRGFTAFKGAGTMRSGAPLHLVLVGPYANRLAAAAALDKIEEMPGVGQPILQLVPPAAGLR
jgi:cell division septation protein DedD